MKFSKFSGALALASAIALSACGGAGGTVDADADGDGEVSTEELANAAEQVSDDMKPEPGQYRASVSFVSADIPGAPPEMVEMMSGMMSQSHEFCMTAEMAEVRRFSGRVFGLIQPIYDCIRHQHTPKIVFHPAGRAGGRAAGGASA